MLDFIENFERYLLGIIFGAFVVASVLITIVAWRKKRFLSFFSLATTVGLLCGGFWYFSFDPYRWKQSNDEQRYPMVNDLAQRKLLLGKTQGEVRDLLGSPSVQMSEDNSRMVYWVFGGDRSKFGEKMNCKLIVFFDKNQRANSIKLYSKYGGEIEKLP